MTDNPFEKVLDRLREKGWIKGRYHMDESSCLLGAAMMERAVYWFSCGLTANNTLIVSIIESQYPDRIEFGVVPDFNDHPDTTFEDVEKVLEKAAVKWEEERVMRDD